MNASSEWLKQAKYDLETAKDMFKASRYPYCVFMCHLSLEKALKARYAGKFKVIPPKTHDLNYLCSKAKIVLSEDDSIFIDELNDLSVHTRYPDELKKILKEYTKARAIDILKRSKKVLLWLKENR